MALNFYVIMAALAFRKRTFFGQLKSPRNLRDFGGIFVRKAVRESMFGKAPFNGSLMIKG